MVLRVYGVSSAVTSELSMVSSGLWIYGGKKPWEMEMVGANNA
jgi:hypothetical protein